MAAWAEKTPAQPQAVSLSAVAWGAESVPKKNLGDPDVAASKRATRCGSALRICQNEKARTKYGQQKSSWRQRDVKESANKHSNNTSTYRQAIEMRTDSSHQHVCLCDRKKIDSEVADCFFVSHFVSAV